MVSQVRPTTAAYESSSFHLARLVMRSWRVLAIGVFLGTLLGVAGAVLIHPSYHAEVVAMVAVDNSSGGAVASALGPLASIASLAGVGNANGASEEEIEYLKSKKLTANFINERTLLPLLFPRRWDDSGKAWIGAAPTLGDGIQRFDRHIRTVLQDQRTGMLRIGITFWNRELAAKWANEYVAEANQDLREAAIAEAEKSIKYLYNELDKSNIIGVQQGIDRLIETQINKVMLANVRPDYAFKVIDPARVPDKDKFVSPNRPLLLIGGFILGLVGAIFYVLIRREIQRVTLDPERRDR